MRICVYLGGSGKKILTSAFDSLTPMSLYMATFRRFDGAFSWFFIELETYSVERDICFIGTAQRPNCSYNKGYIAYFYCACAKRLYFRFLLPVYLAYWPRKCATCWATHVDHFHQVWSWYDYPSPSYSIVGADTLRDLDLWPFDLGQWSNMAGHVVNPSTKFEDPTPIRSRLMSYDVRHRLPLTVRLEPLRRITWPVFRGKFFPNIWNPWPRFVYSLCNPTALR